MAGGYSVRSRCGTGTWSIRWLYRAVDNRDALEAALTEAFAAETFTVIACPIGRKAYDGRF